MIVADVSGPVTLKAALATGRLPGVETTSSMAREHRAIAAINGDFFRPSGRPVGAFAHGGTLVQTPLTWAANIAFGRGGHSAFIGHQDVSVRLVTRGSGVSRRIGRVNQGRPTGKNVRLYTRQGGRIARAPRNACSARLLRTGAFTVHPSTSEVTANYRVKKVACRRKRMDLGRGVVVAGRRWGPSSTFVRDLRHQRRQQVAWSLGWPGVVETLGGNPVLVRDGEIAWQNVRGDHSIFRRHPRTGVGLRADGKVLFVTVDGRQRRSKGMTLIAFAKLMRSLGALWALNLDGGGSTTMVVRGSVVNSPSDGRERAVGSALMLVPERPAGSGIKTLAPTIDRQPAAEVAFEDERPLTQASFDSSARDPASMGGLASWLKSEGRYLPRGLQAVARRYDLAVKRLAPRTE